MWPRMFSIALFCASSVAAATPPPLAKRLRAATESCRAMFDDEADTKPDVIDDQRNGYLRVSGSYPTCGCECSATAAAFKTAAGDYRVLAFETWSCEWKSALSGVDWQKVLPTDLRAELAPDLAHYQGEAIFALHAELPRHGTDVVITVEPLPLGMRLRCPSGICTEVSEAVAETGYTDGGEADRRYTASQKLRFEKVVLKWDRTTGRFTLGERGAAKKQSRAEFLERCGRWGPSC